MTFPDDHLCDISISPSGTCRRGVYNQVAAAPALCANVSRMENCKIDGSRRGCVTGCDSVGLTVSRVRGEATRPRLSTPRTARDTGCRRARRGRLRTCVCAPPPRRRRCAQQAQAVDCASRAAADAGADMQDVQMQARLRGSLARSAVRALTQRAAHSTHAYPARARAHAPYAYPARARPFDACISRSRAPIRRMHIPYT